MTRKPFRIAVLLREVRDPRPPADIAEEGVMIRARGARRLLNLGDLEALEAGLGLADPADAQVTAVAVGPEGVEEWLRLALSMGAARAVRVWDPAMEGADSVAEARVLTKVVRVLDPDLFLTGTRLPDQGDAPAPALAAAQLGLPCCGRAIGLELRKGNAWVTRRGDRGARQRVTLSFPCAVLFDPGVREPRYPSLEALLEGLEAEVEVWGLPDLGLARREVGEQGSTLTDAHFAFPRPNPVRVVTPDARLNAIERMQALLSGGIQPREAVVHLGSAEETAEGLFRIFCEEGLLPDGGD